MLQAMQTCLDAAPGIVVVGTALDAASARVLIGREKPDVFILDLDLPGRASIKLVREMRPVFPATAVLATSERPSPEDGRLLMSIGVKGYVSNAMTPGQLVADVRSVAAGDIVFAAEATGGFAEAPEPLTARELQVLKLLAGAQPTSVIAKELGLAQRTVEYHLTHIYAKLQVEGRLEAMARAQQLGLISLRGRILN